MILPGGVLYSFTSSSGGSQAHGAAPTKPSNGHGLLQGAPGSTPGLALRKFNPFASCVENQQNKGFGRVSTGVEGQPNNQAQWRETIMELTPFDRMGLLNMEDAD